MRTFTLPLKRVTSEQIPGTGSHSGPLGSVFGWFGPLKVMSTFGRSEHGQFWPGGSEPFPFTDLQKVAEASKLSTTQNSSDSFASTFGLPFNTFSEISERTPDAPCFHLSGFPFKTSHETTAGLPVVPFYQHFLVGRASPY